MIIKKNNWKNLKMNAAGVPIKEFVGLRSKCILIYKMMKLMLRNVKE